MRPCEFLTCHFFGGWGGGGVLQVSGCKRTVVNHWVLRCICFSHFFQFSLSHSAVRWNSTDWHNCLLHFSQSKRLSVRRRIDWVRREWLRARFTPSNFTQIPHCSVSLIRHSDNYSTILRKREVLLVTTFSIISLFISYSDILCFCSVLLTLSYLTTHLSFQWHFTITPCFRFIQSLNLRQGTTQLS